MQRIAVIGSGISGLAAAHYLSRKYEVTLFEKDERLGGHTHTIDVETAAGVVPVDTGFIVHNERTYPNLVRLLRELGVQTQPSDMSFAVHCHDTGFGYSSHGANGFFAQRRNLLRPAHFGLLADILRFNRQALRLLDDPEAESLTLGEYVESLRLGAAFRDFYLYPMASAVWSTSLAQIEEFPAATLIRFFDNHGMLGVHTHPQWRVLCGGSSTYIAPLIAPLRKRIHTGAALEGIRRHSAGVELQHGSGYAEWFDQVVLACHGGQALALLTDATPTEKDVLSQFRTSRNEAVLHTDERVLPPSRRARAAWNYHLHRDSTRGAAVTYDVNRLQSLTTPEQFCVTLNDTGLIDPARVLRRLTYFHPLYTREAIGAQSRWAELSGRNRTHFCGAYWHYGFHEDGLNSALRVARALGVEC